MAKMTNKIRNVIFEKAINKLYGERFVTEKAAFEKNHSEIILKMVKRIAKKNGVDYDLLTTVYKPYVRYDRHFYYRTDSGEFHEELGNIFYNQDYYALCDENGKTKFDLVQDYKEQHVYRSATSDGDLPHTAEERFNEDERKELISIFKKYAAFMKEVIASACMIRDVINSASTTKQLADTSPELGELIPETEACTALVPVATIKKVSALFRK